MNVDFSIFKYNQEENVFPTRLESAQRWINYGIDNLLPLKFINLNETSPTQSGIINKKANYTAGDGIIYQDEAFKSWAKSCNDGRGLHNLIYHCALDYHTYNGFSIQVIWYKNQRKIADIYYQDFSTLRRGFYKSEAINLEDSTQNMSDQGVWLSRDWRDRYKFIPEFYHFYNPDVATNPNIPVPDEAVFLYYYEKGQGREWYPVPSWYSALKSIEVEKELINFQYANVKQSFNPSGILKMPFPDDIETQEKLKNKIKEELQGTSNTGKIFTVFSDGTGTAEKAVEWFPLNTSPDDKKIEEYMRIARESIIIAHELPSASLIGIPGGPSLAGDGNTIAVASKDFFNMTILKARKRILNQVNGLIKAAGFDYEVVIEENIPQEYLKTKSE